MLARISRVQVRVQAGIHGKGFGKGIALFFCSALLYITTNNNDKAVSLSSYGGGHLKSTLGGPRTEVAERAANFVLYVDIICDKQLNTRISTYYLIQKMPRVSKRKQHLAKIAPLVVEANKRRKDIRQIEKDRAFRIRQREEDDFWDEYESDLVRYFSSDESSSDGEEEEVDSDKGHEERQEETGTYKPGLSVFHSGSGDYLRAMRGTGSLSAEKRKRRRIRELEKVALNSQSIKTMFVA